MRECPVDPDRRRRSVASPGPRQGGVFLHRAIGRPEHPGAGLGREFRAVVVSKRHSHVCFPIGP